MLGFIFLGASTGSSWGLGTALTRRAGFAIYYQTNDTGIKHGKRWYSFDVNIYKNILLWKTLIWHVFLPEPQMQPPLLFSSSFFSSSWIWLLPRRDPLCPFRPLISTITKTDTQIIQLNSSIHSSIFDIYIKNSHTEALKIEQNLVGHRLFLWLWQRGWWCQHRRLLIVSPVLCWGIPVRAGVYCCHSIYKININRR